MGHQPPSRPRPRRGAFTLIEMVVVIGIISGLMAMGIPGIVSQIKRADLYNTMNIISTLHSFCHQAAREFDTSVTPATPRAETYKITVKKDRVVFQRSGGTLPIQIKPYDLGKQFAFADGSSSDIVTPFSITLEDNWKPLKYRYVSASPWVLPATYTRGSDWENTGVTDVITSGSDLVIDYLPRTGFVAYGGTVSAIELVLRDSKNRRMILTFWPTGAYNVKSG
jgi:prepilin-type N-terminal cleavage/methylation domain-containing protein